MGFQIAIDGPAGAGKSTIARKVAEALSFIYVDTGAMYRAMAYYFHRKGISPQDRETIVSHCQEADVAIRYREGNQVVLLNGEDVTPFLRTQEVSAVASVTSAVPEVRAHLLDLQRGLAREYSVVMDGRDIGTQILPKAQVKIYLTASVEVRAKRRRQELSQKGEACDLETIRQEIALRDKRDMEREVSPLVQAPDAVLVDSSDLSIQEVTEKILGLVRERMKA